MKPNAFPARLRVKEPYRFREAYSASKVAVDQRLVVTLLPSIGPEPKLGISIPKKTGNAPVRNYWKRLIREAFRQNRQQFPEGWDIFVRPRKGSVPDFEGICHSLIRLARRAVTAQPSSKR